jgi:hypothetical protein
MQLRRCRKPTTANAPLVRGGVAAGLEPLPAGLNSVHGLVSLARGGEKLLPERRINRL